MRYFRMVLGTSAQQIEENSKVKLRDFAYDSPITAVNTYMHKNMRNGLSFLIYRVEENESAYTGFSFDEKHENFEKVYTYIMELLNDVFGIKKVKLEPEEITMFEYSDCLKEARRRDFANYSAAFVQSANLWMFDYDNLNSKDHHYYFEEKIVDEKQERCCSLYD